MTDADERARRGSSFGAVAAAYAGLRPDYPVDAVRWCLAPAERDIRSLRVLDLGAGTGKLTALLTGLGAQVTAVEPDPAMLAELRRGLPSVIALPGSDLPTRAWAPRRFTRRQPAVATRPKRKCRLDQQSRSGLLSS